MSEATIQTVEGWVFRLQPSQQPNPRGILVAIHGWTGNETSMGIFARNLHSSYWTIFPRAPFESPTGGFSWAREAKGVAQDYATFQAVGIELIQRVKSILTKNHLDTVPIHLMGFSQGAALALTISLEPHFPTEKVACLAGFLPVNMPVQVSNHSREYLIAHGKQDTIVPISHAYQAFEYLEKQKAHVDFCETDSGHKLGTTCFRTLESFFLEQA